MTFHRISTKQSCPSTPFPTERGFVASSSPVCPLRPFTQRRLQRNVTTHVANSAASWRGLPTADTCEVASDFNDEGQDFVTARVLIHASVAQVWRVLTDFEKLQDVVPYLIACEAVPSPNPARKRIKQSAGVQCSWWKLQAQALLEIQLREISTERKELHFEMIEGDFKEYRGRFFVEADPNGLSSILVFDAVIEPLENIPQMLFAHAVQFWLPFNLKGIVNEAERMAIKEASVSPFTEASLESQALLKRESSVRQRSFQSIRKIRSRRKRANPADYLGTAFVPLPNVPGELKGGRSVRQCTLPAFELNASQLDGVEVHLRKLDSSEYLHRRVVCTLRIGAPVTSVWNVLTDYERLVDFVPNLAVSEIIPCSLGAPEDYRRIRQVVQKFQTYIQLQAESVLDVVECPKGEIQFRQVSGFVQRLQGKWILKPVENDWCDSETDTLLTYALEIRTPHSEVPLELIEPVFEQAAIEGLPLNLTAIKQEVLRLEGRPSPTRLCRDFDVLKRELMNCYAKNENVFPARSQLREDRRTDLERAITAHGGPSKVSARMGWKLPKKGRKPKGYWDDFENLKHELMTFSAENGIRGLPSKTEINQAGRIDLRRAIEKWGGVHAVTELMELEDWPRGNAVELNQLKQLPKMKIDVRDVDKLC